MASLLLSPLLLIPPRFHRQFPPLKCQGINGTLVTLLGSQARRCSCAGLAAAVGPHVPGHGVLEVPGFRGTLSLLGVYLLHHVFARGCEDVLLSPHD